jgi:hypothetical protein
MPSQTDTLQQMLKDMQQVYGADDARCVLFLNKIRAFQTALWHTQWKIRLRPLNEEGMIRALDAIYNEQQRLCAYTEILRLIREILSYDGGEMALRVLEMTSRLIAHYKQKHPPSLSPPRPRRTATDTDSLCPTCNLLVDREL